MAASAGLFRLADRIALSATIGSKLHNFHFLERSCPFWIEPWTKNPFLHQVWPFYLLFYFLHFILVHCWILLVLLTFSTLLNDWRLQLFTAYSTLLELFWSEHLALRKIFGSILFSSFSPFVLIFCILCTVEPPNYDHFLKEKHKLKIVIDGILN